MEIGFSGSSFFIEKVLGFPKPSLLLLLRFEWVLLGFTELYWVLLGFTGFYWVLLGFTGFYWVLLGSTGFYRVFVMGSI